MLATPQPRQAPTGSSTLTPSNSGLPPGLANNSALSALLPPRIPAFWLTIKSYRLLLRFFPRVMDANVLSSPVMANGNAWRQAKPFSAFASPSLYSEPPRGVTGNGNINGYSQPNPLGGISGGVGTGVDLGTSSGTAGKRGAMAAQFVDGAWGGQGLSTTMNQGWAAARPGTIHGSPALGSVPAFQPANVEPFSSSSHAQAPSVKPWAHAPQNAVPPPPRNTGKKKD